MDTAQDDDSDSKCPWNHLPDVPLINIYSFLSDQDRSTMSQVCRHWKKPFTSPSLWRLRRYDLGGYRLRNAEHRASGFAEAFGNHLRFLTIICNHPSYSTCKLFQRAMESLLQKLQNKCQLREFRFERLEMDRFWRLDQLRDRLVMTVSRFVRQQRQLREFDMAYAQLTISAGCRILEALGLACGTKLKKLFIEDFYHSRLAAFQILRFKRGMSRFTNLQHLALNYGYLSDDVINILTDKLPGRLESLKIRIYRSDPHHHQINSLTWSAFRRACPRLKVNAWFENIGSATEVKPVLNPEMPLTDLHIWTGFDEQADWQLAEMLRHIHRHFSKTLRVCDLEMDNAHELVDEEVIMLLGRCKQLTELGFNGSIRVSTVEGICELLRENKLDLKKFHLTACGLSELEWAELSFIRDRYEREFENTNLDFRLSTDLIIDTI